MVFHWSLSGSKALQISSTLLSIPADLNNDVVFDGFHPSTFFQVLYSLYQSFGDCIERANYIWYNRHFHVA